MRRHTTVQSRNRSTAAACAAFVYPNVTHGTGIDANLGVVVIPRGLFGAAYVPVPWSVWHMLFSKDCDRVPWFKQKHIKEGTIQVDEILSTCSQTFRDTATKSLNLE